MHNCNAIKAGNEVGKNGLTAAGRNLQKHGSRAGSVFPKAIGNVEQINAQGNKVLNSIINHPNVSIINRHHARFGNIMEYKTPIGGARFSADGKSFIGFIEP